MRTVHLRSNPGRGHFLDQRVLAACGKKVFEWSQGRNPRLNITDYVPRVKCEACRVQLDRRLESGKWYVVANDKWNTGRLRRTR